MKTRPISSSPAAGLLAVGLALLALSGCGDDVPESVAREVGAPPSVAGRGTVAGTVRLTDELARTREGYRLGELDLVSLLDTQRTHLASQRSYWEAMRSDYADLVDLERFLDRELVFTGGDS